MVPFVSVPRKPSTVTCDRRVAPIWGRKFGESGRPHLGQALKFGQQALLELPHLRTIVVPRGGHVERQHPRGREARIDRAERRIRADQEPGPAGQQHAERHLRGHECGLQPMAPARDPHAAVEQTDATPRCDPRGHDAEGERGAGGRAGHERGHAQIDRGPPDAGHVGEGRNRRAHEHGRQTEAHARARDRQEEHFPHDGADHLNARRANGAADRQLARAAPELHEHEPGGVRHGDDEEQRDGPEHEPQRPALDPDHRVRERGDVDGPPGVGRRILHTERALHVVEIRPRLLNRHP